MARNTNGVPTDLRVEYETNPANVEPDSPRFSWRGNAPKRGAKQSGYRLLVARTPDALAVERGNLWDTGKVESMESTSVSYDGTSLESDEEYYWTVRIWDEDDRPSEWADVAAFSTALENASEWTGDWIGHQPNGGDSSGYRSEWSPSGTDSSEWVQIDLGRAHRIDRIELHPAEPYDGPKTPDGMPVSAVYSWEETDEDAELRDGPAGFGFPAQYRVEAAADAGFEDSWIVAARTEDSRENPGTDTVVIDADGDTAARYVRVTAVEPYEFDPSAPPKDSFQQTKPEYVGEERRRWTTFALAAVAVRDDDGTDLARDRPVTASSSVEEPGWGTQRLVDGRYTSQTTSGSPLLRNEISLRQDATVKRARAHVCTLGYGELYVNGERIGDDVLDPGWTQYDERALYNTYDVSESLQSGPNAVGVWLGRGWFSRNRRDWTGFGSPRAILQLEIEYEDGITRTVTTNGSWRASSSPIVENDIYDGETYDARLEQPGWAKPGFDDEDWDSAAVLEGPGGDLVPQRTPPIRATETIDPIDVRDHEDGPIVDFGQNLVGWVELTVEGATSGERVRIQHAETVREDGSLSLVDLRAADATDTFVASGPERTTYCPRFTYHGFRYAQIQNYPDDLSLEDVRAHVVHTDLTSIGSFECSNEELNRVQRNARRGLRGNVHSVLTDCPQRDERFGWTGDNHIAARALLYNFDGARFYEKWMDDHADARSEHGYVADTIPYGFGSIPEDPTWGITQVTIPWHLYRHYGDVGVLERHYEGMRRYVDYWFDESDGGIVPDEYGNYGDWLALENTDGRRGLPLDLFNTAFHYHATALFAKIAEALENEADSKRYADRADRIVDAFDDAFFDPEETKYGPGTQSSYAVPLFVGLVPAEREDEVAANLAEKVRSDGEKLETGFLGTRPLLRVLVDHGYQELAYEVVSQPERPGWVYMVRQGATTMWERWDSDARVGDGMNSFNHSPFTFVSEWFYEAVAGVRFDEAMRGNASIELAPMVVEDLEWAEGGLDTVHGPLRSRWERTDDGVSIEAMIPWNTTAKVRIPDDGKTIGVTERGETIWQRGEPTSLPPGVIDAGIEDGGVVLKVESGSYRFDVTL